MTKEVFGPYEPVFMGPAVWAGIAEELPPQLVEKKVWLSTFDPATIAHQPAAGLPESYTLDVGLMVAVDELRKSKGFPTFGMLQDLHANLVRAALKSEGRK